MIKPTLIIFLFALATISFSCGNSDAQVQLQPSEQKQVELVVFIDKSKSVSFENPIILSKATDKLKKAFSVLKNPGDRISFYYLHGNTAGATKIYSYTIPSVNFPPRSNTMEKNTIRRNHNFDVSHELGICKNNFSEYLGLNNTAITNMGTDIIGVFEIVSRNLNANSQKHILIFSDGIQTSSGFKCDPKTTGQAIDLANTHLAQIPEKYQIDKSKLNNSKAVMVLPYDPLSTTHNKYFNEYWQRIFSEYGIELTIE
jgi:hypothetical protein